RARLEGRKRRRPAGRRASALCVAICVVVQPPKLQPGSCPRRPAERLGCPNRRLSRPPVRTIALYLPPLANREIPSLFSLSATARWHIGCCTAGAQNRAAKTASFRA